MTSRFRVAFSFAGEHRKVVSNAAAILAAHFGQERILYDEYHEEEFAQDDLVFDLPNLYFEQSDLIVVVICPNYLTKPWCGVEWSAIYGALKMKGKKKEILLARYSQVEAKGLYGTAGYLDLDKKTAMEFAVAIARRLAGMEKRVRDFYARHLCEPHPTAVSRRKRRANNGAGWPTHLPDHSWNIADHDDARKKFELLITGGTHRGILFIVGESGSGKTHLTSLFLSWMWKFPEIRCSRLDFKGSPNLDEEIDSFAGHLHAQRRSGSRSGVTSQLAEILDVLLERRVPTLLVFDTFELAGDAQNWILSVLLAFVPLSPWLKIVIAGQKPVSCDVFPWCAHCSVPAVLKPPSPKHWHEYGVQYNPAISYEFIEALHFQCKGQSALMAQVCRAGTTP